MARLKFNVFANYAGTIASSLIGFFVVPFYIRFLGDEGYGMVSFIVSLQAMMAIMDFGLSTSATREFSKSSADTKNRTHSPRDLLRTLEVFYGVLALLIFVGLTLASEWVSIKWVKADKISPEMIQTCIILGAGVIAARWPVSLYYGFLRGYEKQVRLNAITSSMSLIKGVGGVLVLAIVSPTVIAFYWWQLIFGLFEIISLFILTWSDLGGIFKKKARFNFELLKTVWGFAANVGGVSLFAILFKQADKIIISKFLPIEFVGYYNSAGVASTGLSRIWSPVQSALFPRFTKLATLGDHEGTAKVFHRYVTILAFVLAPAAVMLSFFSRDILLLWLRQPKIADAAGPALSLLSASMLFTGLQSLPYMLQLSNNMAWLSLYSNAISSVLVIPLMAWLIIKFGIVGGAMGWLIASVLLFLIVPQIMFRHVLIGHASRYYFRDTLPFIVSSLMTLGLARFMIPVLGFSPAPILFLTTAALVYTVIALWFSPVVREAANELPWRRILRAIGAIKKRDHGSAA